MNGEILIGAQLLLFTKKILSVEDPEHRVMTCRAGAVLAERMVQQQHPALAMTGAF